MSMGIEGEGDMDRWAPVTVQGGGGGVKFVSKLKFKWIQIEFKSIQILAVPKRMFLSSKTLK
jgi:hypothetical protein